MLGGLSFILDKCHFYEQQAYNKAYSNFLVHSNLDKFTIFDIYHVKKEANLGV